MPGRHVVIIGGGLSGLTAAIRLTEAGARVSLLEAAPQLGGRTRSYLEPASGELTDNGPHLLIGAYNSTRRLLSDCGAAGNVTWQPSLTLPLWDERRGHFRLQPSRLLPLLLALPIAITHLPGHSLKSAGSLFAMALHPPTRQTVAAWLAGLHIPASLQRDLLEPLCLGAMNEAIETADARSFARVLKESFAGHQSARLGWFNKPLSEALIAPLEHRARQSGVDIRLRSRVASLKSEAGRPILTFRDGTTLRADSVVLAIPAHARDLLLGIRHAGETRPITNIHLWFDDTNLSLPAPFVGGIGTLGQWFFDIRQQIPSANPGHFCAVISAHDGDHPDLVGQVAKELAMIGRWPAHASPRHHRIITEQRATARVASSLQPANLPKGVIDACEAPRSGDLPATIETAIQRGEAAAKNCLLSSA
ncbi:MAG TPA: FAD-dependent oxidoreductase [Mariprofundaceae bacterium]|nr:FAD-dependent oxidoreductase [Mariprofundaceae bacterium]